MKKLVSTFVMVSFFAIAFPVIAEGQQRWCPPRRNNNARNGRIFRTRGINFQRPSFYRRHRNLVNIGVATGGGALVGGLIGGNRKSIGKGALVGAGAGALYTYVLRPKRRR